MAEKENINIFLKFFLIGWTLALLTLPAMFLNYFGNLILGYIFNINLSFLNWSLITIIIFLYFNHRNGLSDLETEYISSRHKFENDLRHEYEEKQKGLEDDFEKERKNIIQEYQAKERQLEFDYKKKSGDFQTYVALEKKELQNAWADLASKENDLEWERIRMERTLNDERNRMKEILENTRPFAHSAKLCADMKSYIFDSAADYLKNKKNPAVGTATEIKRTLKKQFKVAEAMCKEMSYKYEFLLSIFPELKTYVDDEEELLGLAENENLEDFEEHHDRSRDYLSDEEWNSLSSTQRNQLALDRWVKSNHNNHVIGMLYELYISSRLRNEGFATVEYGIKHGLADLGRDIIAKKGNKTLIVQCKNWSNNKVIHENVVTQLKGTSLEYEIAHEDENVIPFLISTTQVSSTAEKFAKLLGVEIRIVPLGKFPMIKCNINGTNKIYHLPFDQQYERAEINKSGEFYAWTVEEAEAAGFRRALRHYFT